MKKIKTFILISSLMALSPAAQAEDFLDWLKSVTPVKSEGGAKDQAPTDSATLLTLEPKEEEMYPQISEDGRSLIVTVSDGKESWISKRAAENGDPLNVVTNDARAFDSVRWHGADSVSFFSERAGGLGLWLRAADGQGIVRRAKELNGRFTQPVLLADGSMIAVRLAAEGKQQGTQKSSHSDFENWSTPGFRSEIVLISEQGSERVLSQGVNPALSPDGQWIVFSMPTGRSYHLYMMRTDGSELAQLTDDRSADVQPTWSRDGNWIVFTSNRAEMDLRNPDKSNWDIWAIDREGKNLSQITMDKAKDGAPSIGSDGRVYFHSDRKITKEMKELHDVGSMTGEFHIWSIKVPQLEGKAKK